jgi:hypothetical protein
VALVATPVLAQQPGGPSGYQPPGRPPGYQQSAYPPGYGYQPLNYRMNSGQPTGQPANNLPVPPGYRPRTPPPQMQPQVQAQRPAPAPGSMPGSGSGGKIMYFQKPADALTVTGGADSNAGAVAQLDGPNRVPPIPVPVPDIPGSTLPPPPPPSRYLPESGGAAGRSLTPPLTRPDVPAPTGVGLPPAPVFVKNTQPEMQPKTDQGDIPPSTSLKKELKIVPVPPQYIQLPSRERIFTVYDDDQLEKAIMERLREDLKADKKWTPELEKYLVFPALPVISPPGVAYQPKTVGYEPRKLMVEPGYVVHRRLHFEEKNAERTGWDLGPLQTLVSATYFWRDTLLLPQSLASGCVYGFWDTSAGKCLPGNTSPYYLYPLGLTRTGTIVEGAAITGGFFLFP